MRWQSGYLIAATPVWDTESESPKYQPTRDNWGPLTVPAGSYFMLGDNRDNSQDSRYWGFVERDQIRGEPWLVYYSSDHSLGAAPSWFRRIRWARLGTTIH
jgi:signal peptidase I